MTNMNCGGVKPIKLTSGEIGRVISCAYQILILAEAEEPEVHSLGYVSSPLAEKCLDNVIEMLERKGKPYEVKLEKLEVVQHRIGGVTIN